ncbi:ribosome-binding factor A [Desulfuromonas versatilis]|uniref:Ribosome-binding factor A n=1 Tax=Desulfuromonas versatilis TaxID=2802975 RepID=A0ABN6DY28_9BACT|nr:ribosome-binding factor A [Desulfuromonas versatilis]BCR04829.1 ribosome-binding factor A [Desulfuromonas versatilis]
MEFLRSHRVGEQIHKEISALLVRGLKDPRIGFVTITAVEVTPDLHLARVYYSVLGDDKSRAATQKGLESSIPYIRREIGKHLRMKYTPDLMFKFDTSLEYGNRIESLLRDIHEKSSDDQGDSEKD